jgi:hypothetical protein
VARTWGRKGRPYRRAQAQTFAEETHCYLCHQWVDQGLANYRGSRARSVHHLIPPDIAPELANDRTNMRLAHLGCNAKYGRGAYKGAPSPGTPPRVRRGRRTWGHRALVVQGVGSAGVSRPDRDW